MTKYHRHTARIAVLFERDDGAVLELDKIFTAHFGLSKRFRCKGAICSPNCCANISAWSFVLLVMNDYSQEGAGKISLHGNGMGLPSLEEVERRAREIAMINERNPDEFTDADWAQARKELLGAEHPTPPEETKQNAELTDDWYVAAASRGHRAPRPGVDEEEETVGEHLVTGGVEEAAHDQMLEARREELEQEGGIV